MYIVVSGALSAKIGGEEKMTYAANGFFGEVALISGEPRKATVTATEASELITFDRAAFKRLLGKAEPYMKEYAKKNYNMDL
jgi:NTE family protein